MTTDVVSEPADEEPGPGLGDFSEDELAVLARVGAVVRRIRFGTVSLVIQDGRVVQIETAEKFRLR